MTGKTKARVLVADDDESILSLIKDVLENEDFSVTAVPGGAECLETLEHASPDLLILDVMMPSINGLDVADAVRVDPRLRDVKIIFLTVIKQTEVKPSLLKKLGAVDYIQKPFDNKDFVSRVRNALCAK